MRLAASQRGLAEALQLLLAPQADRLALLGGIALGEVARIDDEDRAVGRIDDAAQDFRVEGPAVLAPIGAHDRIGAVAMAQDLAVAQLQLVVRALRENELGGLSEQLGAGVA